mgnify:CR=1 FL=1
MIFTVKTKALFIPKKCVINFKHFSQTPEFAFLILFLRQ